MPSAAFLSLKFPTAELTSRFTLSVPMTPFNTEAVVSITAVVPASYVLLAAVIPVTVNVAGVMSAVVVAVSFTV